MKTRTPAIIPTGEDLLGLLRVF